MVKTLILVLMIGVVAWVERAAAQDAPPVNSISRTSIADYQVGPGDLLSIRVSGMREFEQAIRVSNSGRIRVPYVGIMFAAGLTARELEREIARQIKEHELVNEPAVQIQVDQYRARPAYAVGEVMAPGQFVMTGDMHLLDLISRTGGLTDSADTTAILYRRSVPKPAVAAKLLTIDSGGSEPVVEAPPAPHVSAAPLIDAPSDVQVIPVNLENLRSGAQPELNIPLQGGDVLYVPRVQGRIFYIIGDVHIPGAYSMPRRSGVSAAQAIIYAGGPLATAKNKSAFLMRHDANGIPQAIPVDFLAIIKGKKPDIPVQPDDIIFIPNSAAKTIGIGLLNFLPRLLQQFLIF